LIAGRWIVELHNWGLEFHAKRTKKRFSITWDSVLTRTMEIEANRVMIAENAVATCSSARARGIR
jgi:hypothetical protein